MVHSPAETSLASLSGTSPRSLTPSKGDSLALARDDDAESASLPKTPPPGVQGSLPALFATPPTHKPGRSERHSTSEGKNRDNIAQKMLWWQTLQENFREELPVDDFFESYLVRPETEDDNQIDQLVAQSVSALTTAADKARTTNAEANFDDSLVRYLQAVVETFPDATKPWFANTKSAKFPSIDKQDHFTAPDITGGQPGAERPTKYTWTDAGLVLELKVDVDIFKAGQINNDSAESKNALMQLAKSARSLLASGRGCFVFVVAVTKTMARILRFDRSGFRTSAAFDWTQDSAVIPTFLWRLYNPNTDAATTSSAYLYGADPTVTIPTAAEKQKMYKIWQKTSSYRSADKPLSLEEATRDSRWLEALKGDRRVRCFTIGKPLFQSEGLFSRATRVDRVVLETDLIPRVYALKDAWRQVYRRPEKDYYDVIARYCKENGHSTAGMARCLGSLELPHRTNSAAMDGQQRCRVRSLLTPVGLPLNQFPSSRHLILALRRAVEHHQIAYDAGVIHRDISEGNVLFDEETMDGFLVDWDYAEFNPNGMRNFQAWFPDRADEDKYPSNVKSLKDLTGTFPFYAIHRLEEKNTVHEAWHDLESFYWLLVWVILRYTDHTHIHGPYACHRLFDADDAAGTKRTWLLANPALNSDDSPLFKLASRLRSVVLAQNPVVVAPDHEEFSIPGYSALVVPAPAKKVLTHETMKLIFAQVTEHDSWKIFKDSPAEAFTPPSVTTENESKRQTNTANSSRLLRAAVENAAIGKSHGSQGHSDGGGKRRRDSDDITRPSATGSASNSTLSGSEDSESTPKKARTVAAPVSGQIKSRMKPRVREGRGKR